MNRTALILELHHPLPGPGARAGPDWAMAAAAVYWPLARSLEDLVERTTESVLTLAVSPSWTALAADPFAQALVRAELLARASGCEGDRLLAHYALDVHDGDLLEPFRQAARTGVVELIPTSATLTWLPSVTSEPIVARAQVRLAASDHERRFGFRPQGIWLPFLAYLPGLESVMAESRLRYFGVAEHAFLRGTTYPPDGIFGPLITPAGVAAFSVSPSFTRAVGDLAVDFARDCRDGDRDHANARLAEIAPRANPASRQGSPSAPVVVAAVSVHDLGLPSRHDSAWLDRLLRSLEADWRPTTLGRYLDRRREGPLGRPGPASGGPLSARPHGSDLFDRCREAAEILASLVERRRQLGRLGRRAVAQMTRSLLLAQSLDWHLPPSAPISAEAGLARAHRHLARFHQLAHLVEAGRLEAALVARYELGPGFLADIELGLLGD